MKVVLEPIALRRDHRGSVFEPIASNRFSDQRSVHVVVTEPGCVRGNHYHPDSTETLVVLGPSVIRYREDTTIKEIILVRDEAARITIPPGVAHAIKNTGTTPGILVAFNNSELVETIRDIVFET